MKTYQWYILVNQSGKGLYKRGHMGREVYEFEIETALCIQSIFAEKTNIDKIHITHMEFSTPPEGSTYRSMTEPIHRTIKLTPHITESLWVNVWHSVAEASFLAQHGTPNHISLIEAFSITGMNAYLAYCRECRDWQPHPPMFVDLHPQVRAAWSKVEVRAARMMKDGFVALDKG